MAIGQVVTNGGQNVIVDLLDSTTRAGVSTTWYIGIGTGTTTPAVADTVMQTPVETRGTATPSQPAVDVARHTGTVTLTADRSVTEVGLFTASTGGTLLLRAVHSAVSVLNGDQLTYLVDISVQDVSE